MPATREQIVQEHLVYTCRCGFVDRGHATPLIARSLWTAMRNEESAPSLRPYRDFTIEGHPCFRVMYRQSMTLPIPVLGPTPIGYEARYAVRRHLSLARRKAVALRIFMRVSEGFEGIQTGFPLRLRAGGYSGEDLMSDLIGFHQAVEGYTDADVDRMCGRISTEAALAVWDEHVAPHGSLSDLQVRQWYAPSIYPCAECTGDTSIPAELRHIRPASIPSLEAVHVPDILPGETWSSSPDRTVADFDSTGALRGFHAGGPGGGGVPPRARR